MNNDRDPEIDRQFAATERAVAQTANAIARQVSTLLRKTSKYGHVAPDTVKELLIVSLFREYPAALIWLDRQDGKGSMRLAEALKDYLDLWASH